MCEEERHKHKVKKNISNLSRTYFEKLKPNLIIKN